jgi:hypothetical protein
MRETRFSTRLLLAAGAAAALIAVPVSVSPHALALGWQVAAAQSARGLHSDWRGHGDDSHQNSSANGNAFGRCDERGPARARDASAGRVQDGRGLHYGCAWNDGGNVQDDGSAPLDDEAPPS